MDPNILGEIQRECESPPDEKRRRSKSVDCESPNYEDLLGAVGDDDDL